MVLVSCQYRIDQDCVQLPVYAVCGTVVATGCVTLLTAVLQIGSVFDKVENAAKRVAEVGVMISEPFQFCWGYKHF
jgi:hypothetical protein